MKTNNIVMELKTQVRIMEKSGNVLTQQLKRLKCTDPEYQEYFIERQILWEKCDLIDDLIKKLVPMQRIPVKVKLRKIWCILCT